MRRIICFVFLVSLILPQVLFSGSEIEMTFDLSSSPYDCDFPAAMCYDDTNDVLWVIDSYQIDSEVRIMELDPDNGDIIGGPYSNPDVQAASGLVYDSTNDDLIVVIGGAAGSNKIVRVDLSDPTSASDIGDITFDYPIDLNWDDSSEQYLWTAENTGTAGWWVHEIDITGNIQQGMGVLAFFPGGLMVDDDYIYCQGNIDGWIFRHDKETGDPAHEDGLWPMGSPFEQVDENYISNLEFSDEEGKFWILSWMNNEIYLVRYFYTNIQSTSLGHIKSLFQ